MVATIASEHLVVRTLLSANIARDACDDNGMTALVHATSKGFEGIARLLRQPASSLRKGNFFSLSITPTASPSAIAAADKAAEELLQADRSEGTSSPTSGVATATAKQKKAKLAAVAMLSSPRRDSREAADELRDSSMPSSPPQRTSAAASAAASAATFFNWAIGRGDSSADASHDASRNASRNGSCSASCNGSVHGGNAFLHEAEGEELVTRVTAALASLDERAAATEEGEPPDHDGEAERDMTGASTTLGDVGDLPILPPRPALPHPAQPAANAGQQEGHDVAPLRLRRQGGVAVTESVKCDRKAVAEAVSLALSQASLPKPTHHPQLVPVVVPVDFLCPITYELMREPVLVADGSTYEREAIEHWLKTHSTSPVTNERLAHTMIVPNNMARSLIRDFAATHPTLTECIEFWQVIERKKAR